MTSRRKLLDRFLRRWPHATKMGFQAALNSAAESKGIPDAMKGVGTHYRPVATAWEPRQHTVRVFEAQLPNTMRLYDIRNIAHQLFDNTGCTLEAWLITDEGFAEKKIWDIREELDSRAFSSPPQVKLQGAATMCMPK